MKNCPSLEYTIFLGLSRQEDSGRVLAALEASPLLARVHRVEYLGASRREPGLDISLRKVPGLPFMEERVLGLARKLLPLAGQTTVSVVCGDTTYLVTEDDQWPPKL